MNVPQNNTQRGATKIEFIFLSLVFIGVFAFATDYYIGLMHRAKVAVMLQLGTALKSAVRLTILDYKLGAGRVSNYVKMDGQRVQVEPGTGIPTATAAGIGKAYTVNKNFYIKYLNNPPRAIFYYASDLPDCRVEYRSGGKVKIITSGC